MSAKQKYPAEAALAVARELCRHLKPITARLICAGSLRRRKPEVGDVELLYIPQRGHVDDGTLWGSEGGNLVNAKLDDLIRSGVIAKRENTNGGTSWGKLNKLAVHVASGIPVDFFEATEINWYNYLVCRTGPAESNTRIASAAIARGCKWHPYNSGFTDATGSMQRMDSEAAVFQFAGLPYREPWDRH